MDALRCRCCLARNSEFDVFPSIPNRWRFSYYKPSQALDVKLKQIYAPNPVYIKPYLLGRSETK